MKYFWNAILSVPGLILLAILMFMASARAEDYSAKFGPGIVNNETNGGTKMFGIRREEEIMDGVTDAVELGGYVDNLGDGRKGAAVLKAQLGVRPGQKEGLFGKAFFGPCGITSTDSQLGGNLQFCTDVGLGVRDKDTFMSIGYAHISSAGIFMPNHGRDYLLFEMGVRLGD